MKRKVIQTKKQESWRNQTVRSSYGSKKGKKKPILNKRKLLLYFFYLAIVMTVVLFIVIAVVARDLPNPNQLLDREITESTKIYDRSGENILYEIHGDEKRTLISLSDLPDHVKYASISIEDKNFFNHGGFSVWAIFRTAVTNVLYKRRAGGSTLTQQFIKNAVLTPEKKLSRKIKEVVMAYKLEKKFSKDEILQMYLNEIPYGSNAYGIEAASLKYFNKHAKDISIAESALLAALVQSPSRYSPYGPNKDLLLGRKDYIIKLMADQGYIDKDQVEEAQAEEIIFAGPETNITAPHFVMYIKSILAEKYGEKVVEQGGLQIYTTLDVYKQKIAEEVIKEKTENYLEKYNANNASLVSLDPKTGEILAMVGSRNYFDVDIDGQVNVATRPRQPGSSFKPIVYANLFTKGYTPETIIYDVETNFSNSSEPYIPRNYTLQESGPVSIRKALAGSLNIPAVKALYLAGIDDTLDLAEKAGYSTLYPRDNFGLALVLGGAEVALLEHTNAFSMFARDGKVHDIVSILKVVDKKGEVLEENKSDEREVIEPQISRMINEVLSDNSARAFMFGLNNSLTLKNRPAGVKTGTTNEFRDAWTVGYTPSLVTGVWVGNTNNDKMNRGSDGSILAAPIWKDYMDRVLGDTPVEEFKKPDYYTSNKDIIDGKQEEMEILIDKSTGQLANNNTLSENLESIKAIDHHSILFYVDKESPLGDAPENPENDPQFKNWEEGVIKWAEKNSTTTQLLKDFENFHNPENLPSVEIINPSDNQEVSSNSLIVEISADAKRGISSITYLINGNIWYQGGASDQLIDQALPPLSTGFHALSVRVCDDVNNCSEDTVNFNLKSSTQTNGGTSSVEINSPTTGTALNEIDFPLSIDIGLTNIENISQLLVFATHKDSGQVQLLADEKKINSTNNTIEWLNYPSESGQYIIYAEIKTWEGEVIKSGDIVSSIS